MSNVSSSKFGPAELADIQDIFYSENSNSDISKKVSAYNVALNLSESVGVKRKILVLRNHSFEFIAKNVVKMSVPFRFQPEFVFTDYSEILQVEKYNLDDFDALIFWIDFNLISTDALDEYFSYLAKLVSKVREKYFRAIFFSEPVTNTKLNQQAFVRSLEELNCIRIDVGIEKGSRRRFETIPFLGTFLNLDEQAKCSVLLTLHLARELQSPIKLVAVDLDNTLYDGVLAEDGPNRLRIRDDHVRLHEFLTTLHESGLIVSYLSKNVKEDFDELISLNSTLRPVLELGQNNKINWNPKSVNLLEICSELNIHHDSVLFIDDNPGELGNMIHNLPLVRCIYVPSSEQSLSIDHILNNYPINLKTNNLTDKLRNRDLLANEARSSFISSEGSVMSYITDANISLKFYKNCNDQFRRYSQLSKKTNQFNSALRRIEEQEIPQLINRGDYVAVGVSMSDRFSDSGNIGFVLAHTSKEKIIVEDLALSCRALGRGIESVLFEQVFTFLKEYFQKEAIEILYKEGPRNQPALTFFDNNYDCKFIDGAILIHRLMDDKAKEISELVDIEWKDMSDEYQ